MADEWVSIKGVLIHIGAFIDFLSIFFDFAICDYIYFFYKLHYMLSYFSVYEPRVYSLNNVQNLSEILLYNIPEIRVSNRE